MIYLVCENLQQKEIIHYCFGKCKKLLVAGILYNTMIWWLCNVNDCPYKDHDTETPDKHENEPITLRKLLPVLPEGE